MYDELPECINCAGESGADDNLCRPCRSVLSFSHPRIADERELRDLARDPRIPLGPDDDGEEFEPISDEEMRARQNYYAARWEADPFETPEETLRRNWPNVFDGEPILTAMARGVEVRA